MPQQGIMATVLATATPARLAAAKMALSTSGTQTYGTARYTGSSLYGPAPPPSVTRTVLSPAERAGLVFDPSTLALQRQEGGARGGGQGLRGVLLRRDEPMPREPFLGASAARKPSGDRLLDAISAVRGGGRRGYGESKTMRLAGKAYFERG